MVSALQCEDQEASLSWGPAACTFFQTWLVEMELQNRWIMLWPPHGLWGCVLVLVMSVFVLHWRAGTGQIKSDIL